MLVLAFLGVGVITSKATATFPMRTTSDPSIPRSLVETISAIHFEVSHCQLSFVLEEEKEASSSTRWSSLVKMLSVMGYVYIHGGS